MVEPQLLRRNVTKRVNEVNSFLGKYLGMILVGIILVLLVLGAVYYLYKIGKIQDIIFPFLLFVKLPPEMEAFLCLTRLEVYDIL